jgi:hypothetical protein
LHQTPKTQKNHTITMKKQLIAIASVAMIAGVVSFSSCKKDDTTAPSITVTGGNTQSQSLPATAGQGTYTYPVVTATDDVDGDLTSSVTYTGTVDPNTKGSYTLTYTVSDAAGNTATQEVTVTIVNDAEYLVGTYAVKDSMYNPSIAVGTYTDMITSDGSTNGKIWVTKFGNYVNGIVYMTVNAAQAVNIPSQTVTCGSPANQRIFTNTVLAQGGTVTGTGAAGTTIVIDYKETVISPSSTANDVETYVKQ